MKGKVILLAIACAGISSGLNSAMAQVSIAVGGCAPRQAFCYRPAPVCYSFPLFSYGYSSYWGNSAFFYGTAPRFSTVSPLLDYAEETPVTRVPPPVALTQAEPIIVSPVAPFTWKN